MNNESVITFDCCGERMAIVRLNEKAHIMPYEEWEKVYGKLHPERWAYKQKRIIN